LQIADCRLQIELKKGDGSLLLTDERDLTRLVAIIRLPSPFLGSW
jgi:hypothetical protein